MGPSEGDRGLRVAICQARSPLRANSQKLEANSFKQSSIKLIFFVSLPPIKNNNLKI